MADFASDFGSSLGNKLIPDGDALNRKIDSKRETFLKGISSTKHGKKEDPTYLHFRFIFDFGDTSFIDPETFLAPSPLFRDANTDKVAEETNTREFNSNSGDFNFNSFNDIIPPGTNGAIGIDALNKINASNEGRFVTDMDFFYGSKFLVKERAELGAFNMNGGGVAYMGASQFLGQRSEKRKEMMTAFKKGLRFVNEKCPYYFQTISGLDQLLKVDIKNIHKVGGKPQRSGTLTIDCLESIDMRMFSLAELYRKAIYDYTHHRVMLPENLRKFRMWLVVSEIRNIQLSYGINDILNPFSIPSVAQGANFLDSFNSQTGLLNNTEGLLQKSTPQDPSQPTDRFGSYTLGPYAFIYQFDQCEFDFDDTYPSFSIIDNKGGAAVTNKFKIHVGRVKDYKIQFNLLADLLGKDDNIKSMILSDVWGAKGSDYIGYDYAGSTGIVGIDPSSTGNPSEFFAQLASNFITNTVSDLKEQGVSIVQNALLGNIYGAGGINPGAAGRNVQSLVNTLRDGIPNPFGDNTPQAQGLGGPGQRQYPTINEDVYPNVPGSAQQNLGTVYTDSEGNPVVLNEDAYPNVPGPSLGLPDREYLAPGGDEYSNVPGPDLGVPDRVYPTINDDIYPTNPGPDGGLPDREYPVPGGDEYTDVPGADLGVPGRIYPTVQDDIYPTNPGPDSGLPDREYPTISDDVYSDPNVINTENIGDVYPEENNEYPPIEENVYDIPDSQDTNNIGDVYPDVTNQYGEINENEYEIEQPTQTQNIGDVYPDSEIKYPEVNEKVYDATSIQETNNLETIYEKRTPEYPNVNDVVYKNGSTFTRGLNEDVYRTVPGNDLGVPSREYGTINEDVYPNKDITVNTTQIGRVYPRNNNENI